ncbi:UNVERIFIED_ORG: S-DNA-T family DNA segregation ATPase FtsK/SpoIIIE [Pseudomonas lini]
MKTEHKAIIERAKLLDVPASALAHELLVHDMVEAGLFEVKNLRAPYHSLNEGQQQEVIDRMTEAANKAATNAISIISSRNVDTIVVEVVDAKFKKKAITVTASIEADDPNRHGLIDVAGKLCLLVLAPNDYAEGLDFIQPDRDQPDLPLHVSDITGGLFGQTPTGPDEPDGEHPLGTNEELSALVGQSRTDDGKEFGDYTYDDAAQLVVLKVTSTLDAAWIQSRMAIDSDQAAVLLMRLLDNKVIELESEGATALEHKFKVIAKLNDVA